MQLQNRTRFPAAIFRSVIGDDRFAAAVVARVTFDLGAGEPKPADEQPWIVSAEPWENEHGQMNGDEVFTRSGVDLFLFGKAWAPGRMAAEVDVTVEAGAFRRHAVVIGDRAWVRRGGRQLVPTAPAPFAFMPLTLERAFGGKDKWDGLDVAYPDNPAGRGYAVEEKSAEGKLLPNIEDPRFRIARWDDRPDPVGFGMCPLTCGLRLRNSVELTEETKQLKALKPALFNSAFPAMIAPKVEIGDPVRVTGVVQTGRPIAFRVPSVDLVVRLRFGDELIERPLTVDQIGIEAEKNRAFVTYRYSFRYKVYRMQKRSCDLLIAPNAGATAARSQ